MCRPKKKTEWSKKSEWNRDLRKWEGKSLHASMCAHVHRCMSACVCVCGVVCYWQHACDTSVPASARARLSVCVCVHMHVRLCVCLHLWSGLRHRWSVEWRSMRLKQSCNLLMDWGGSNSENQSWLLKGLQLVHRLYSLLVHAYSGHCKCTNTNHLKDKQSAGVDCSADHRD